MTLPDSFFLPLYESFPELEKNPKDFMNKLLQVYQNIAIRTNKKDISLYEADIELPNGQLFFATTSPFQEKRPGFRKVIETGVLATGANAIAHGITFPATNTFHFTRIYGVIEDATPPTLYVPIPDNVTNVTVDTTNINITIPAGYNGYFGIVVLEYVKQN